MDNISKIYYINLESRTDRREEFENECENYFKGDVLGNRVERFNAYKHEQGLLGCSISHLEVIKKARADNCKYIIVFEDDFQFIVPREVFENNIKELFNQVENNKLDFKVVMLGYNAINRTHYNDLLDITTNAQTCSGYLVNSKYFDELIACWEEGIKMYIQTMQDWIYCCDQYWKKLQNEKWYIFKTRIGLQRPGYSDNAKAFTNHEC